MKVERITYYGRSTERLFYIASSLSVGNVVANIYTPNNGKLTAINFRHLETTVFDLNFSFTNSGKYCFVIYEGDNDPGLILLVTIV